MVYEIKNSSLSVKIDSLGAEMLSLKSADGTEYLWQGSKETWEEHAPNLFPYIARLTDGKFEFQDQQYEMKIHGLAKYMDFQVEKQLEDEIEFCLTSDENTRRQYPFLFQFRINYTLKESSVWITYKVVNEDDKKMYFGIGGHPGFNVPLEEGLTFEDYELCFQDRCRPKRIGFTEDCFLNGCKESFELEEERTQKLSHDMFDDDAIVLENMSKSVTLSSKKGNRKVKVTYPDMDYLGIWHWPKTKTDYVCIEPWSSLPSRKNVIENLETQENLIGLDAKETYKNQWEIEII